MKNTESVLFAPCFTEEVERVRIDGKFDPDADIWMGTRSTPIAGLTGGEPTTTITVGTTTYGTNYVEPDTGYDDPPDDHPDTADFDFC